MKKIRRKIAAIALSLITITSLAACGGGAKESTSADGAAASITIGTLNLVNGDLIAQYEKWYEDELGVDVKLIKFDSGKDINSAIASGSIDIGQEGTSPAALAISNDLDIQVFWIGDIIGSAETLVARDGSGISSLADLKGKKVATPFASTAHYSLLNALKLEGVDQNDVELLDLQPDDIFAAWTRGDIDAAYVWYPVLSSLLENGTAITDSEQLADKGIVTADTNVVRREFAEANPELITRFVELQLKANDVINNDSTKAAQEISSILEIDEADAAEQITQFQYLNKDQQLEYLDGNFAETLKNTADFLVEQKSIKSAPDLNTFKERVTSEYVKAASE
ncbi:MAG: aliphatic sulfonate ABC transporter substrate-binding protein [Eubacterium sp.]|nr:aliphatic sulfonate ABC transporter substrate-binding protein [Eubacterium sp.]